MQLCRRLATADQPPGSGHQKQQKQESGGGDDGPLTSSTPTATPPSTPSATARLKEAVIKGKCVYLFYNFSNSSRYKDPVCDN